MNPAQGVAVWLPCIACQVAGGCVCHGHGMHKAFALGTFKKPESNYVLPASTAAACIQFGPRLTGDVVEHIGSRDIAELVAVSNPYHV